jgi:uncharacterized protein YjiK
MKRPSIHLPPTAALAAVLVIPLSLSWTQPAGSQVPQLHRYQLDNTAPLSARLPRDLREVSGLTADSRGNIFCHNDEQGIVYQIDPVLGTVARKFSVGSRLLRRDYEGIAVAESLMFLVTSNGTIFEFSSAPSGGRAEARTYTTGLSAGWNIEGLCYDPSRQSLLLACKDHPSKDRHRCVYSFSLRSHRLDPTPRFVLDLRRIEKEWGIGQFHPSSIERHPVSGTFFVLSSSEPAILELSAAGEILAAAALPRSAHRQPEGLTFGADLTLFISNEGKDHGIVARYPYRP